MPKQIIVKESLRELKDLQRKSGELISRRLRILIEFKKTGISKSAVSENTGINHNSITKCRTIYLKEGIESFHYYLQLRICFCFSYLDYITNQFFIIYLTVSKQGSFIDK